MATSIVSGMFAGAMPPPLGSRDDHRVRQRGPARGGATSQWPLRERPALTHDKTIGIVETCEGGNNRPGGPYPSEQRVLLLDPEDQVWREARGVFRPTSSFGHVKYFDLQFADVSGCCPWAPEQAHKRNVGEGLSCLESMPSHEDMCGGDSFDLTSNSVWLWLGISG